MDMERNPELHAMLKNPFLLGGETAGGPRLEDEDVCTVASIGGGAFTAPFMMAELNTRQVRRSSALFEAAGAPYGAAFCYREQMLVGNEKVAAKLANPVPPVHKREAMREQGRLPKPGEGPSAEERAKSRFKFYFVGQAATSGRRLVTSVSGGDPGYTETAKMATETAVALLHERAILHATTLGYRGGVFTPAFALGSVLYRRLAAAEIEFNDEALTGFSNPEDFLANAVAQPQSKL
jgi:short subunit dehydrogenase-like uncharacterized protein